MIALLQELVERRAETMPAALAVVFDDDHLTYGELSSASDRLAHLLHDAGCVPGDRVCFLIPKSPVAIVSMLGILKAGCIYVPMDPSSPPDRLAHVLAATEPKVLLASAPVSSTLDRLLATEATGSMPRVGWAGPERPLDVAFQVAFTYADLGSYPTGGIDRVAEVDDPAHILFTSGSTGIPKGVVITHANVAHFLEWAVGYFDIRPGERLSGHSPLHFDLSTFDVFGALSSGATLYPVPMELNLLPGRLAGFIREAALTQWFSVPAVLTHMARHDVVGRGDFPSLKRLLWCGDVFPTPPLRHWMARLSHVVFTNLYGPTEATIASSHHTLTEMPAQDTEAVPIGRACAGEELLVLDGAGRRAAPGEVGDLHIAGVGLSPGYWRDPERTSAAFVPHPDAPGDRMYRTGDLASVAGDGLVYFHGRRDLQVKSRGYRIELGEIETAMGAIGELAEAVVVAVPTDRLEGKALCCAYVTRGGDGPTPARLRVALARSLPPYMLPTRWRRYDLLPRNANGKIDRPAIMERFAEDR